MPTTGEVSLYFHIPFCSHKCGYCHFFVLPDKEPLKKQLLTALKIEWERILPLLENKTIVSIYFGGGTPSLFGAKAIGTILDWIRKSSLTIAPDVEISLEVNPENGQLELLRAFAAVGINRLSIGVQSLDDHSLLSIDRKHNSRAALLAIENASRAGIANLTIDLMYDLPSQTMESFDRTLARLKELPITHLSLYNLTFEAPSLFQKREKSLKPLQPSPEVSLQMLQKAITFLEEIGLKRYEISAFAKEGFASRHNLGYWTARPFLGLGPSAFSYWEGKRFRNIANLSRYDALLKEGKAPVDFEEKLEGAARLGELLAVELRLLTGVHLPLFQTRHGELPQSLSAAISECEKKGWLERRQNHLRLSAQGLLFYDSVASELI
jgi:oxygen-independent coproporphyrinogen III oxidase